MDEKIDRELNLYWHAYNYRNASTEDADRACRLERLLRAQYLATDSETDMGLYLDACFVRYALIEHISYSELEHSRYWQRQKKRDRAERIKHGLSTDDETQEGQGV